MDQNLGNNNIQNCGLVVSCLKSTKYQGIRTCCCASVTGIFSNDLIMILFECSQPSFISRSFVSFWHAHVASNYRICK